MATTGPAQWHTHSSPLSPSAAGLWDRWGIPETSPERHPRAGASGTRAAALSITASNPSRRGWWCSGVLQNSRRPAAGLARFLVSLESALWLEGDAEAVGQDLAELG